MIYKVKIDKRLFEVEIQDIHARPVIALVDGIEIEVWPEDGKDAQRESATVAGLGSPSSQLTRHGSQPARERRPAVTGNNHSTDKEIRAPIPGVIIAVCVQPGEDVTTGQELCILEAMKMKNSIRASHAGKIASIKILVGQHVQHRELLMEFGD